MPPLARTLSAETDREIHVAAARLRSRLPARQRPRVELSECDDCRTRLAGSRVLLRGLAKLSTPPLSRDFAQRVRRFRPELGLSALAITESYLRLRYLPAPAASDLRLLREQVARFRP